MRFVPIKKAILWSLCLFFLICCQEEDEQANYLATPATISETLWRLQYIESASGSLQIPPNEFRETLHIYFNSDTTFRAGSPCNAGGGKYVATRDGSIQVKVLGTTYMLCEDRRMEWEGRFFDALRKVERYVVEEDRLLLIGESLLVFRQDIPPEQPDCFDFEGVQIHTDPCISAQCKIRTIANGEDTIAFSYENKLLKMMNLKYSHPALIDRESQFTYDAESRLIKVEAVNPVTRQRAMMKEIIWSSNGLPEEVISYEGNGVRVRQTFTYNAEGRMIRYIHRELGDALVFRKEYAYDDRGNPVEEKTFNAQGAWGVTRRYEYDYKTNPFKALGYPTVYDIEPEVLSYFTTNNVVKVTEQFPQQSEAVIRRYVYTYNDFCMPVEVKVSSDLCTVASVQYLFDCNP